MPSENNNEKRLTIILEYRVSEYSKGEIVLWLNISDDAATMLNGGL